MTKIQKQALMDVACGLYSDFDDPREALIDVIEILTETTLPEMLVRVGRGDTKLPREAAK